MKFRFEIPVIIKGREDRNDYYFIVIVRENFPILLQIGVMLVLRGMQGEHTIKKITFLEKDNEMGGYQEDTVEITLGSLFNHEDIWHPTPGERKSLEDAGWSLENP